MKFVPLTVIKVNGRTIEKKVMAFCNSRIILPEVGKNGGTFFKYEDREDLTKIYRKKYEVTESFYTVIKLLSDEVTFSAPTDELIKLIRIQEQDLSSNTSLIKVLGNGMAGDMALEISSSADEAAGSDGWTREVTIKLIDSNGAVHSWFSGSGTISIADTSSAGTASITDTNITFVNGIAKVTITGDSAAWVAAETATLTVDDVTVLGYVITGGTTVVTIV